MARLPKELVRDFVREGNFKSIKYIEEALKDIFKDTIQEALEAEIEEELGYSKYDLANKSTSNVIENVHRQFIKVTKSKGVFPTDISLLKQLYLVVIDLDKKWDRSFKIG